MEERWQFRNLLIKISVVISTFVALSALTVMTVYAANKVVIIDSGEIVEEEASEEFEGSIQWRYDLSTGTLENHKIIIPLGTDITEGGINLDVRYFDGTVAVSFTASDEEFYQVNPPYGDFSYLKDAYGEYDGEKVRMIFSFSENIVCETSYENLIHGNQVSLEITPMSELGDNIVLVDPEHGGKAAGISVGDTVEKEVLLKLAKKVEKMAADKPYKVILTRTSDTYISTENKVKLISMIDPDYYIGLELSSDIEDTKNFGMYATYNDSYYRHGTQNVSFANTILRSACISTSNRGNGLVVAGDENVILMTMDIPGTVLYAGYLSNTDECYLLGTDEYLDKIAEGIINGLDLIIK